MNGMRVYVGGRFWVLRDSRWLMDVATTFFPNATNRAAEIRRDPREVDSLLGGLQKRMRHRR